METKDILQYYINKRVYFSEWIEDWTYGSVNKNKMEKWYNEARRVWKVPLTFEDFEYCIRNTIIKPCTPCKPKKRHAQNNSSYRRQKYHKKKELSLKEQDKRAWREKKSDRRDQSIDKKGWTILQRDSNKLERRKVKNAIKCDPDWDNWSHPLRRECLNPWDFY